MKLEELESVSPSLVQKLNEIGVTSVESLIVKGFLDTKTLLPEVEEKELNQVFLEAWRKKGFWIMTAAEYAEMEKQRLCFSTGSKALDKLIGGGIWSWWIAEFYGQQGLGKSQLLMTIVAEAANKDYTSIYIDTERTCRKSRILEIAKNRGLDHDKIDRNVIFIQSVGTEILFEIINRLPATIESRNVKVICVDSLISPFRAEYIGREMLATRQQLLNRALNKLKIMASVYNLAVAISNQVVAVPIQTFHGYEYKPTGGFILGHAGEPIVEIIRSEGSKRIARLVDSSWLPEGQVVFRITEKGATDV
ncbi:MAG: ATPase domain-containing protein [Candidatus Bathyarchaeia archaeon]